MASIPIKALLYESSRVFYLFWLFRVSFIVNEFIFSCMSFGLSVFVPGIPLLLRLVAFEIIACEFGLVLGTSEFIIYPRVFCTPCDFYSVRLECWMKPEALSRPEPGPETKTRSRLSGTCLPFAVYFW